MGEYKIRDGLIDYRRSANLTQKEMGEKLFMSRQTYAKYESKKPPVPDLDTLCRMAEVTNKSVDYLLLAKNHLRTLFSAISPKTFSYCARPISIWTFRI